MKKVYVEAGSAMKKGVSKSLRKRHSVPRWALLLIVILVPCFSAKFPDRSDRRTEVVQVASAQVASAMPVESAPEQPPSGCVLSPALPQSVSQWQELICLAAGEFSIDANLISTLLWWESDGDMWAVSQAGARGLMQVMPGHFGIEADGHYTQKELERMHAPLSNIRHGCMYLRRCLDASRAAGLGRWSALAAYNGGITGVIGQRVYWNESIRLANGVEDLYQRVRQ